MFRGPLSLWSWTNDESVVASVEPIYGEYRYRYSYKFCIAMLFVLVGI